MEGTFCILTPTENCSILIAEYNSDGRKINGFPIEVQVLGALQERDAFFFACRSSADTLSVSLSEPRPSSMEFPCSCRPLSSPSTK
jgi:hypothetical protein